VAAEVPVADPLELDAVTVTRKVRPTSIELSRECLLRRSLRRIDVVTALRDLGYTDFFSLSTRAGVKKLDASDAEGTVDCLATKPNQLPDLGPALRTGRLKR
jgi:uncharacterized ParB-like nuclease family protein